MKIKNIHIVAPMLLCPTVMMAQDVMTNAVEKNVKANQMVVTKSGDVKYYNTDDLKKVAIDNKTGKITITTNSGAEDSYLNSVKNISFAKSVNNASVKITEANGWLESAYAEWDLADGIDSYNVYVKGGQYADYTKIDAELVRIYKDHGRADVVGLQAGTYSLKVAPVKDGVEGEASEVANLTVKNYMRQGFTFLNYNNIGAYNNDGTLKKDAVVVYVTKDNAKTVTAKLSSGTFTGLQGIIKAYEKGNVTTPLDIRIIGLLSNGDTDEFGSSAEGIQIKGKKADNELNITIEGIGDDATIKGFGFLLRNCKSVEMRNLAVMRQMDDGISLDTDNSNIWLHHIDIFYGKSGSGDHAKGDGSIDIKSDSKYVTVDHCHFWDTGKSSMAGMKSESGPNYLTYHHNWFDHSDSRHARVRTMSVHMWNNYFDGVAKYGVGSTMGSSVFMENNYYRHSKDPFLISKQGTDAKGDGTFSGENGGIIKGYGNVIAEKGASSNYTPIAYSTNNTSFDYYDAKTRDEKVPSTVVALAGGTSYDNFDTNSSLMYSYTPDAGDDVPGNVTGYYGAGRLNHGDFQYQFNNATDDESYEINKALASKLDSYSGNGLVTTFAGSSSSSSESGSGDSGSSESGSGSGEETKGDDSGSGSQTVGENVFCTFDKSGTPSNSMFTVSGNGTTKTTATIDGVTYSTALKMESATSIKFTTTEAMTMTLYFGNSETASFKLNGTSYVGTESTYTTDIEAGSYEITKKNSANLFAIKLVKK